MDSNPYAAPDRPVSPVESAEQVSAGRLFIRCSIALTLLQLLLVPGTLLAEFVPRYFSKPVTPLTGIAFQALVTAIFSYWWSRHVSLRSALAGGTAFCVLAWGFLLTGCVIVAPDRGIPLREVPIFGLLFAGSLAVSLIAAVLGRRRRVRGSSHGQAG